MTETHTDEPRTDVEPSLREWLQSAQDRFGYQTNELKNALRTEFKEHNLIDWSRRFDEMFDLWFRYAYRPPISPEAQQTRIRAQKIALKKGRAQLAERDKKIAIEAKIDLLNQMWPNGKTPAESTAKDLVQYGETMGAYGRRVATLARTQHPRTLGKRFLTADLLAELFNTSGPFNNPRKTDK